MFKFVLLGLGLLSCVLNEVNTHPKGATCSTLKLKFGRVRYRQRGRFVKFSCNTGFIIAGEKYSTCHNGLWDSPVPKCVRASCVKVNPPINGLIYPSHRGAVLNFFCKPGYELWGPNTTYCDGRNWDNNLPACIASNMKPSLSCDFESEDLCGWNHDVRHDFDWIRMNYVTPSGHLGTGPSFDHTKGEGKNGYYMYIESSSRNENDTARLISPIYNKMPGKNVCLEFYYHMYGASIGQLRVYLKKESDSWILEPQKALFWSWQNHGNKWLRSLTRIGPIDEDFQIIIEGVRGSSYFSDIAVDDVRIFENCTIEEDAVTTESDVTDTDNFQTFESCLNRCDNDNYIEPPTNSFQYSCGCDETCLDNSTCCPDYIAICVLGPTDDISVSEASTTIETSGSNEEIIIETSTTTTTVKPVITSTNSPGTTTAIIPKRNKTVDINSNDVNSVLPKAKLIPPPFKKYNPVNVTNFNRTPAPFVPKLKKPTLIFLTPSTPPVIVQKVKSSTIPPHTTTRKQTTELFRITSPEPIDDDDDVVTVPEKIDEETTYFIIKKLTTTTDVKIDSNPSSIKNYEVQNQKMIIKEKPETNTNFIIVVIVSVSFILLIVLSTVIVARRYNLFGCRKIQRHGRSSDSQSDVRFLTSDEMLDFNLACPDD